SRRRHTRFSRDWSSDVCSSDLAQSLVDADSDPEVRAVILTGTGRAFCAGLDLRPRPAGAPGGSQRRGGNPTRLYLRDMPPAILRSEERRVGREVTAGGLRVEAE